MMHLFFSFLLADFFICQANLSKLIRARVITYFQWKLSSPARSLPVFNEGLPEHISAVLKMRIYSKAVCFLYLYCGGRGLCMYCGARALTRARRSCLASLSCLTLLSFLAACYLLLPAITSHDLARTATRRQSFGLCFGLSF
jgi:hypothetical protein